MECNNSVGVRPARRVRLIEQGGVVVAYPEPHRTPVLPAAWAPLTRDQQDAVLRACDLAADCLIFKLGSVWEPGGEYRVYRLATEQWGGLSVVCKCPAMTQGSGAPRNTQLLGLSWEPLCALRLAADFCNWDLEAHGHAWCLDVRERPITSA